VNDLGLSVPSQLLISVVEPRWQSGHLQWRGPSGYGWSGSTVQSFLFRTTMSATGDGPAAALKVLT